VKESKYQFRFFQLYLLLSGWLILTYPVFSFAQARSSADSISVLTLKDSSIYLGEVRLKRDSNFVFQVNQRGPMIVDYRDVISLEKKLQKDIDTVAVVPIKPESKPLHIRHSALFFNLGTLIAIGLHYSINYSYTLFLDSSLNVSFRAGYGAYIYQSLHYWPNGTIYDGGGPMIGASADWFGPSNHLETGITYEYFHFHTFVTDVINPVIGYKYQNPHKAFFFRSAIGPWFFLRNVSNETGGTAIPFSFDISLGVTF